MAKKRPSVGELANASQIASKPKSRRVFVVHGHDEGAREKVARFIGKLGLEPVVLHEQPNRGRTIIEKFTDYSDVAYAVVLLTADDEGRAKGENDELEPRARQNVILELGYFLGKLGRDHVSSLRQPGVKVPSDYDGVVYIDFDEGDGWRLRLAQDIKESGLPVSMDDVL